MMFEPRDVGGWRAWLLLIGVVVGWYGFWVVMGWASVSGATGGNHLLEEQPVDDWLLPLGISSGVVGAAICWVAWRMSPLHQDGHMVSPWKWFLPAFLATLGVLAVLGFSTAVAGAPDSVGRGTPLAILPMIGVGGFWAWRRQRKDGAL